MAEKSASPKKKTAVAVKQEMQATLLDVQKSAEERREAEATPAQRIEQRSTQAAVASADACLSKTSSRTSPSFAPASAGRCRKSPRVSNPKWININR